MGSTRRWSTTTILPTCSTELGVKVSDRLRSIYRDIIKTEKSVETDLDIIKNDLREATSVEGAFFCEYEIFKDVYRLQARSIARNGQTVYIGLLTVTDFNSGIPDSKLLNNAMDHLEGAIRLSLRKRMWPPGSVQPSMWCSCQR